MKLIELKTRVAESLGEEVLDLDMLMAGVSSCYADMTSRGYRNFKEIKLTPASLTSMPEGMYLFLAPVDLRKTMYVKIFYQTGVINASRLSLSNSVIQNSVRNGHYRTNLVGIGLHAVYYIKNNEVIIETDSIFGQIVEIKMGYYAKLITPSLATFEPGTSVNNVSLGIRDEYADAVVLYLVWFVAARQSADPTILSMYMNQYKYYMEDVLFELQHEDSYNHLDNVIIHEED